MYWDTLNKDLLISVKLLKMKCSWDNNPKQLASSTEQWFENNKINLFSDPDNPLTWTWLKMCVHVLQLSNLNKLKIGHGEWWEIIEEWCSKLIVYFRKQMDAIIVNKDYSKKY